MGSMHAWILAYARQAEADYQAYLALQDQGQVHECQRLLFLQMPCEKLSKAHLISRGTPPDALQSSHGFIANPLPVLLRLEIEYWPKLRKRRRGLLVSCRHLAREIELLNPSINRNGQRPDNCEYPWIDNQGNVLSPLSWTFASTRLLLSADGKNLLKLIRLAIDRILRDSTT